MESRGSQEIKDLFINKLNIFIMVKLKTLVMILGFLVGSSGSSYAQGFLDKVLKGLEKTNEVLEQTDKLLGGDDNNTSNQNASRSKRVTGFKIVSPHPDLQIQFKRCAASASTVIIDLVMTWYGDDTQIRLGGQGSNKNITMAYDDHGKQYDCYSLGVSIAGGNYGYSMGVTELFPMDVPMKVRLQIENVSESVLEFKRILIKAGSQNDPITLYNVPITRNDVSQNIIPVESDGEPTSIGKLGKTETIARHPLMDPLVNVFGGNNAVYPAFLLYTQSSQNDWKVLGLRGKVKTLVEQYNRQNKIESYTYHFNEDGYLIDIDWSGRKFIFSTDQTTPINRKIYIESEGKREEVKKTDNEQYTYNKQGWLICNESYPITYDYDEQGLCTQIQYTDSYPENIAKIVVKISRNKQGDIILLDEETSFYTEKWNPDTQKITLGEKDGETTFSSQSIKYTYDHKNNWLTCSSEICNIKRDIIYF